MVSRKITFAEFCSYSGALGSWNSKINQNYLKLKCNLFPVQNIDKIQNNHPLGSGRGTGLLSLVKHLVLLQLRWIPGEI